MLLELTLLTEKGENFSLISRSCIEVGADECAGAAVVEEEGEEGDDEEDFCLLGFVLLPLLEGLSFSNDLSKWARAWPLLPAIDSVVTGREGEAGEEVN